MKPLVKLGILLALTLKVVAQNPVVTLSATPDHGTSPLTVNFVASCSTCVVYTWDFGDGQIQSVPGSKQTHTYSKDGKFDAVVAVADKYGKGATVDVIVSVTGDGPPTYAWATRTNAVIPTPTVAPFHATDLAGTIKTDSTLSKGAHIVRLTDGKNVCSGGPAGGNGQSADATPTGGDNDAISNTTETAWLVTCSGANKFIVAMNPKTLKVLSHSASLLGGSFSPSTVSDNLWFWKAPQGKTVVINGVKTVSNGTTLYSLTFPYTGGTECGFSTCMNPAALPTYAVVVDLVKSCAQIPGAPHWQTELSVENLDTVVSEGMSFTGGQDTGHIVVAYNPKTGVCQTMDFMGNGTNPLWYATKTATPVVGINAFNNKPLVCVFDTLHSTSSNGKYAGAGHQQTTGADCGTHGPFLWEFGTPKISPLGLAPKQASGHSSLATTGRTNDNWPQVFHPFTDLFTTFAVGWPQVVGCTTCLDDHHQADRYNNPPFPTLGASGAAGGEVYAIPLDLPPAILCNSSSKPNTCGNPKARFVKTYSSGTIDLSFEAQWAIGAPGQKRTVFCWTTDMLKQLGTHLNWNGTTSPTSDVFCTGLAKQ